MEWEVWTTDGVFDSEHHSWAEIPDDVLVVRVWGHPTLGKVVSWGDTFYGHPSTWKVGAIIADDEFQRVLTLAQDTVIPPSQR